MKDSNVLKRAKMEDGKARATQQGQKRAALGTITNNAGVRIRPFRATKEQAGLTSSGYTLGGAKNDENACSRAQQKTAFPVPTTAQQSFSIHVYPQPMLASVQNTAFTNPEVQELNPALTSLSRPALTNVFFANRTTEEVDSTMVIDSRDDEDFECTSETTPEMRDIDTDSGILFVSEYADGYQCCQCFCHQRPSVIMVPIASGTSHVPLKVNAPYPLLSRLNRPNGTNGVGYRKDSDSSDEDDDERKEKYFQLNTDGTKARFKLSREDWERIPIKTFPSGGRLLSGDWTRIFLEKVKESNPWCSFRFKNNHVRAENSRKIHSAVFFRGGAECKLPECNVKVRFVIQKEKGKHVGVTYVGNVCHSSQQQDRQMKDRKKAELMV